MKTELTRLWKLYKEAWHSHIVFTALIHILFIVLFLTLNFLSSVSTLTSICIVLALVSALIKDSSP